MSLRLAFRGMKRDAFVAQFGGVFEHSPWVMEGAFDAGLDKASETPDALADAGADIVFAASRERQLALLRAHPDLAGRLAVAGELTVESSAEQQSAGLDQCTREEFVDFTRLNEAYTEKFGFPFILAVAGRHRREILTIFAERVQNDAEAEFDTALREVCKIARLRLRRLAEENAG